MITVDMRELESQVNALTEQAKRQIPFAASQAINKAAVRAKKVLPDKARDVFNRPKPFTAGPGATYIKRATKGTLTAEIGFKNIQARYMQYQIAGGTRRQKGFEKALQGMGALPPGWIATPGPGAPMDAFGNIRAKELSAMLMSLKRGIGQYRTSGRGRNRRTRLEAFFVVSPTLPDRRTAHLAPGVWKRIGTGQASRIVPWLLFAPSATYHDKPFEFEKYVHEIVEAHLVEDFKAAFDRAMETAR
jgi:hypothetical protein